MITHTEQKTMERRYSMPYNWSAKDWSRHWRQKNGLWLIAKELAGDIAGKRVLDAGCGDGWYSAKLSKEAALVQGVDYSERAIDFAKAIVRDVSFKQGSITELPFSDESFDYIFSFQVLEHLPPEELPKAIKEFYRVLAPGGLCVISVPSVKRKKSTAHFQHFTPDTLRAVFNPLFKFEKAMGQEYHTFYLHVIERVLENRVWILSRLAEYFNKNIFVSRWNKTSAENGQNVVARFIK